MDGIEQLHIVEFEKWCPKCQFKDKKEEDGPCWDCLADGVSYNGQPIKFKKRAE